MKTITLPGFIHAKVDEWTKELEYYFKPHEDMSEYGYKMLCPHQITAEVPDDINPVAIETEALENKKSELTKAFVKAVAPINQRLQDLKCIESSV